ncbi:hypothetical protein [Streptacidiphilus sp. EB129]|uniref:hypothetical protein n=1 Tax=Streptacidiphilus sp. EB129 TaxID=3156262 RepID=UPI0035112802
MSTTVPSARLPEASGPASPAPHSAQAHAPRIRLIISRWARPWCRSLNFPAATGTCSRGCGGGVGR